MKVVFLGVNDVGMRIYDWLCQYETTTVKALLTERSQLELVRELQPELIVSVGFDTLVPADVLSTPKFGAINLHPSYLPYNRGMSPNVWSIVEGTPPGVTLHYMNEKFDQGEIIARRRVDSDFSDTGKDLHRRLKDAQFELFPDIWPDIEADEVESMPQDSDDGTYHTVDDFRDLCELDPEATVEVKPFLDRLRALSFPPFDNAHIDVDGRTYYVEVDIRPADEEADEKHDGLLSSY